MTGVALELGARIWLARYADTESFRRYASYFQYLDRYIDEQKRHSPHWYLGYRATPNFELPHPRRGDNRHNSHGFRGDEIEQPKPEGRFRIACLGGSTTYTTKIHDYRFSYPYLLREELAQRTGAALDVINAGLAGWTSWESMINFQIRLLELEPDLIIVYHAVNDLHARLVWPPEAYQPDNSGHYARTRTAVIIPSVLERSTLLRMLLVRTGVLRSQYERIVSLLPQPDTYVADEFNEQWVQRTYPQGVFLEVSAEEILERNPPTHFRRNIENIVLLARARGIEVVLATFAHSPQFENVSWSASELHARGYEEMNAVIRSIAQEHGAHLFDFASAFPDDPKYYADGIHVRIPGAQLKARLFADFIIDQGLVPDGQ